MSLEDEFSDVIAKAMRGLEIDAEDLAKEAGVSACEISGLLHGDMDEDAVRKISPALGLDAEALIALPGYIPAPSDVPGIRRIELPFRQWTVNAWLLEKGDTRLLFDTGFGERDLLEKLSVGQVAAVMVTHAHEDHIGGVAALESVGLTVVSEVEAMERQMVSYGDFTVRVVDLSGHKSPAVGYFVEGFGKQVFIVGDAIFAGSMGRCQNNAAYRLAFETLREAFNGIADDCVILPGHGPATTPGQEKVSNPFRAGFS